MYTSYCVCYTCSWEMCQGKITHCMFLLGVHTCTCTFACVMASAVMSGRVPIAPGQVVIGLRVHVTARVTVRCGSLAVVWLGDTYLLIYVWMASVFVHA